MGRKSRILYCHRASAVWTLTCHVGGSRLAGSADGRCSSGTGAGALFAKYGNSQQDRLMNNRRPWHIWRKEE